MTGTAAGAVRDRPRMRRVAPANGAPEAPLWRAALLLLVPVVAAAGALAYAQSGAGRALSVVALAVGGVGLLWLALYRFEWLVLVVLAGRPILDLSHSQPQEGELLSSGPLATAAAGGFALLGVVWLVSRAALGRTRPRAGVAYLAGLLVLALLPGVLGALEPSLAAQELARVGLSMAMLVVLDQVVRNRRQAGRLATAVLLSAVVPLSVGVIRALEQWPTPDERLRSVFLHPNSYGAYLMLVLLLAIALLPTARGLVRAGLAALVLVGLGQLLLTYSRGSWIGFLVGLVIIGVLHNRAVLVGLLLSVVTLPVVAPSILQRLTELGDDRTLTGSAGNTFVWRLDYWRQIVGYLDGRPVEGIGLKMIEVQSPVSTPAHNDLLRAAVEGGLLGLAAYLALGYGLYRLARRALAAAGTLRDHALAVAFAACLAAFVTTSSAGNLLGQAVVNWYLFAVAGCALGVLRGDDEAAASALPGGAPPAGAPDAGRLAGSA